MSLKNAFKMLALAFALSANATSWDKDEFVKFNKNKGAK